VGIVASVVALVFFGCIKKVFVTSTGFKVIVSLHLDCLVEIYLIVKPLKAM